MSLLLTCPSLAVASDSMHSSLSPAADHVSAACLYEDSTGWLARCLRGPHPRVRMPEYEDAFENIYGKEGERLWA